MSTSTPSGSGSGRDDEQDFERRIRRRISHHSSSEDEELELDEDDIRDDNRLLQFLIRNIGVQFYQRTNSNEELVKSLKKSVLKSEAIEKALLTIPRAAFLPDELQQDAYVDSPQRIEHLGFNISAPHMYAMCLEALDIKPGNIILDIGSGTGHLTVLCAYLTGEKGHVYGIDLRKEIIDYAKEKLEKFEKQSNLKFNNITWQVRNCFIPDTENPDLKYDRIHSGACCPKSKLEYLYSLLKPGGILVTPHGDTLIKAVKNGDLVEVEVLGKVRYSDLVIPSEADVKAALAKIERQKATRVVIPDSTFLSDLESMINDPNYSDVTLIVEDQKIYAHKVILSKRSGFFDAMFRSGMQESNSKEIILEDVSYPIFMECLKFIYTDKANITNENAIELLGAANFYKLDRLKALLEKTIKDLITVENAAYVLEAADRHAAKQLYGVALDFIVHNYKEVTKSEAFLSMDKKYLIEITNEICKQVKKF